MTRHLMGNGCYRDGRIADVHPGIVKKAETEKNIRTLLNEAVNSTSP